MSADQSNTGLSAAHALLQGLIDYAGLYPPAKLDMLAAVKNYAAYLRSPDSWMLGRFICPVSRLEEFRAASSPFLPRDGGGTSNGHPVLTPDTHPHHADEPWPISAIIDGDLDENLDAIFAFNREHSRPERGLALIDAAEIKVPTADPAGAATFIDQSLDLIPEEIFPFFEIAVMPEKGSTTPPDLRGPIAALSGADAGAKLRTGGITPDAFPAAERIAEFLIACAAADLPFKATAGLHHPIRAEYPLTYEPNCPRGVMHGFINLFFAAAVVRARSEGGPRPDVGIITKILLETDPSAFVFTTDSLSYRGRPLHAEQLALSRETFALSYGSCSFDEPVADLRKLAVL